MSIQFSRVSPPELAVIYAGEQSLALQNRSLNASNLLQSVLCRDQVEMVRLNEPFRLAPDLEILKQPFVDLLVEQGVLQPINSRTVRLQNMEQLEERRERLTLQDATYYDYILTNWAASQDYGVREHDGTPVSLRDLIEPGPKLTPLSSARPANHIGVACLLLCEGYLLLNQRGRQVTDSGTWGLSAAGILQNAGANTSPFDHILTELVEETGLGADFVDVDSLRLIGIAREFHRAGKPEMYFLVKGHRSLAETQARVNERQGTDAWESVRSDWLPIAGNPQLWPLQERRWQPSARIGLWFLRELLQA